MTSHTPSAGRRVGVRLAGTGIALPQRILTNDQLAKSVDTNDQWITQRTGIRQRYIADPPVNERQLALDAVSAAMREAGTSPNQLDMLICATMTAQMCCPSTAARVVAQLGASPAGAIDISAACSGFVYGLNLASSMIESGRARTVVVVGSEALSRITDWKDRRTCVLFGDGAGAAVLTASDDPAQGCLHQVMASNGNQWHHLYVPRTPDDLPPDDPEFSGTFNTLQMNGREVYKFAVTTLENMIKQVTAAAGIRPADLAVIIPHQSNQRILESVRDKLGLPPEKLYINIDRYGNTSAASVPICLHELRQAGKLKTGDLVLFAALGGGLTWTASLWRL